MSLLKGCHIAWNVHSMTFDDQNISCGTIKFSFPWTNWRWSAIFLRDLLNWAAPCGSMLWCGDVVMWWWEDVVTSGSDDWEVGQKWQKLIRKCRTEYPDKSSKMTGMKNDGMFFLQALAKLLVLQRMYLGCKGEHWCQKIQAWNIRWIHLFGNTWIKIR